MKTRVYLLALASVCGTASIALGQGSLVPPGAPAPTLKTLQQVEPRLPISTPGTTIFNPGSYYLTTNIVAVAGHGIIVQTDNATIDLNGFTMIGPGVGSAAIIVLSGHRTNLVVHNGQIRRWTSGVEGFIHGGRFERLTISHNLGNGLRIGSRCVVRDCTIYTNGAYGIQADASLQVSDCLLELNGIRGVAASRAAQIIRCLVRQNAGEGIFASSEAFISDCQVDGNGGDGIVLDRGTVKDCTVQNNGLHGINAFISCRIVGNHCQANGAAGGGAGIYSALGGHHIENNFVVANDWGISCNPSTGNLIVRNSAQSNNTNYNVVAGNTIGPIVNSGNIGTSSNPHANYTY